MSTPEEIKGYILKLAKEVSNIEGIYTGFVKNVLIPFA